MKRMKRFIQIKEKQNYYINNDEIIRRYLIDINYMSNNWRKSSDRKKLGYDMMFNNIRRNWINNSIKNDW